jgi:hypothetical protein
MIQQTDDRLEMSTIGEHRRELAVEIVGSSM